MANTVTLPPPPAGFELDEENNIPAPPAGFELDAPEAAAKTPTDLPRPIDPAVPLIHAPERPGIMGDPAAGLREFVNQPSMIPQAILGAAAAPGKLAYGVAADVVSKVAGQPEYGGNILPGTGTGRETFGEMPVESFLKTTSEAAPKTTTAAKVLKGVTEMAPLMAMGALPAGLQRAAAIGFGADMALHLPGQFKEYYTELAKPKEQQDANKISDLESQLIQSSVFAPLAISHGINAKNLAITQGDVLRIATRELAASLNGRIPVPEITLESGTEAVAPAANRQLGIRPPGPGNFNQPEVLPLADAAIREAQQRIVPPGQEGVALEALRRAVEPPQVEGVSRRFMEPEGGKVSFRREAEAPVLDATRKARAKAEPEPVAEAAPPAEKPITELTPSEFAEWAKGKDQLAEQNKLAQSETVEAIQAMADRARGEAERARKAVDMDDPATMDAFSSAVGKNQFFNEALRQKTEAKVEVPAKESVTQSVTEVQKQGLLDTAISNIESLQAKLRGSGELQMGVPSAILDTALEAARLALKAGKSVAEAVEAAITHIRKNIKKGDYDEAQIRKLFETEIGRGRAVAEPKVSGQPSTGNTRPVDNRSPVPAAAPDASRTPGTLSEVERMRNLSARGTEAESVPTKVQEQLKTAPESFYQRQSMAGVREVTSKMSDADLAGVGKESDIYTAAKLEQANRQFAAGNDAAGYNIFQEVSAELTRAGQIVNQAKLLQGLLPDNVVKVVNEGLRKDKKDPLKPAQEEALKKTSKERIDKQTELDKATDEWVKDPSDANAAKAEKALDAANKAALEEQRLTHRYQSRSMAALLKAILQGNLLTPMSQVANIVGNISFLPFREGARGIATGIDVIDSYLRGRPRQVGLSNPVETVKGAGRASAEIPEILLRGQDKAIKGESRVGLHPLRAWATQFSKNPDAPTVNGKLTAWDRAKLAVEGTFGVPAEAMLRGLSAGDQPFKGAARARLISEQSRLKGVPENQRALAQKFPELFFDRKIVEQINNESAEAVFQRRSNTLNHFLSWIKSKGDTFDFATSLVLPYKVTPWNIVGELFSFVPPLAIVKAGLEAKRGNIRGAEIAAGKAVTGTVVIGAAMWLYKQGLIAPSLDSKDEQQKARILSGQVLPPNHLNVSGLKRALNGGDPAFQPGDETVDFFRAGGLMGAMMYMTANVGRDLETKPESETELLSIGKNSALEMGRFGLNQSFLKGVASMLDAVQEGDADNAVQAAMNSASAIPLPNTLTAISRAQRQNQVDMRADKPIDQFLNPIRTKLGFLGLDDQMTLKRGLWGEPIPETPKDANAILFNFFDITKGQQVTDDALTLELYRLWRKTANTSVIPTPPKKELTSNSETFVLTPKQQGELQELVGKSRREIAEEMVLNPEFQKEDDEYKIRRLKDAYERGAKLGKQQFLENNVVELTPKPTKAGFK